MIRNLGVLASALLAFLRTGTAFQNFQGTDIHQYHRHNNVRPRQKLQPLHAGAGESSAFLEDLDVFFQTSPYTAAALVCGFKASMADVVAQAQELNKNEEEPKPAVAAVADDNKQKGLALFAKNADWKRNSVFIFYGALYQGITQEFLFNQLYPLWFGTSTELSVVLMKTIFTLLVPTTLLNLPSLYVIKSFVEGFSLQGAMEKYKNDILYQGLLQKFYMLWGPVLIGVFSVVPEHYRVTTIALVSFFWLIILSSISNNVENKATVGEVSSASKTSEKVASSISK